MPIKRTLINHNPLNGRKNLYVDKLLKWDIPKKAFEKTAQHKIFHIRTHKSCAHKNMLMIQFELNYNAIFIIILL